MGRTYGGDRIYANGVFKGKRAMLSLTTGGSAPAYAKGGFNGDIHAILRPIQRGMLQFVGFEVLAPQIAYGPVRLQPGQRTELLAGYVQRLKDIARRRSTSESIELRSRRAARRSPARHRHEMADDSGDAGVMIAASVRSRGGLLVGSSRPIGRRPRAGWPDRLELGPLLVA